MKAADYIVKLVKVAMARAGTLLCVCLVLSVASVGLEILAMTVLLPLADVALGRTIPADDRWVRWLHGLGLRADLRELLLAFTVVFALRILTQVAGRGLSVYLSKRLQARLSSDALYNILTTCSFREIQEKSIGYYITLAGDEVSRAAVVMLMLIDFVSMAILAALYFVAIVDLSRYVGIGVVAFMLATFVLLLGAFRKLHSLGARMIARQQGVHSIFLDSLNGYRSVKAFSAERYVSSRYRSANDEYMHLQFMIDWMNLLIRALPGLLILTGLALYLMFSGPGAWETNNLDKAMIVTTIAFCLRFFPVVGQALNLFMRIIADAKAGRDVIEILAVGHEAVARGSRQLGTKVGSIEARQVSFAFDPAKPVLAGLSARFERGRSYAVTGVSGSGKSTLVDLILHFYPAGAGTILVDGVPNGEFDEKSLRSRVILLGQQVTIFNDTVYNNIAFGETFTKEQVQEAARGAAIYEFVESMPHGYESLLNYQGSNLSGGQRQRIGLARALVRQPEVLILDECTNGLDTETRDAIVNGILKLYKDRIVIFVTHDLWVAQQVDQVIQLGDAPAAIARMDGG